MHELRSPLQRTRSHQRHTSSLEQVSIQPFLFRLLPGIRCFLLLLLRFIPLHFFPNPWIACWLERRARHRKVASSNPGRSGGRIFLSRVNFVCWLLFGVRSTPSLPQWHAKDFGHSAKSADGRLPPKHAYTLDPTKSEWADYVAVQAQCGNLSGNELTRNSSGNTRSQSSQLAEPLWTDPGLKSGISVRELISIKKKRKKSVGG